MTASRVRFLKFCLVGASGGVVNLFSLWVFQEHLFTGIVSESQRVNLSLMVAIILATFNNYCWNRLWTWRDRRARIAKGFWIQLIQYYAVCWVAIALQMLFTNLLLQVMHYLPANMAAIALTAVVNFLANNALTFSVVRIQNPLALLRRLKARVSGFRPQD